MSLVRTTSRGLLGLRVPTCVCVNAARWGRLSPSLLVCDTALMRLRRWFVHLGHTALVGTAWKRSRTLLYCYQVLVSCLWPLWPMVHVFAPASTMHAYLLAEHDHTAHPAWPRCQAPIGLSPVCLVTRSGPCIPWLLECDYAHITRGRALHYDSCGTMVPDDSLLCLFASAHPWPATCFTLSGFVETWHVRHPCWAELHGMFSCPPSFPT
ncbi:hypothetical protein V6N13_081249 [Hibiscus sabdariffa]|uniref:Uncharacterized protein n=1 Tax=Hibiscus sabdariffa TaxID=183260 RepID=A0ABR2P975_9ROSI